MGFAEKIMEKAYSDINKRLNYFEQYKKEILAASNINYELRQKLMLVPQKYWDDFNQYLLKDPEFRKALSAANPKKEEKSKITSKKKENDDFDFDDDDDDEFNFDVDDDEFDFDDDDEDDYKFDFDDDKGTKQSNIEEQISETIDSIFEFFDNEKYSDIDVEYYVKTVTEFLLASDTNGIDNLFENLLIESTPGKDIDSLQKASIGIDSFNVIYYTTVQIGKILNSKVINSYINGGLQKQKTIFAKLNNSINIAYEEYCKRQKTKQNWKKVGRIVGTAILSPLIVTAKVAEWSDNYSNRPDVQERRKASNSSQKQEPKLLAYCRICGKYGYYETIPKTAISDLMSVNTGCGNYKHTPIILEIPDGEINSRTIQYVAYCPLCGKDSGRINNPRMALDSLRTNSSGCGSNRHNYRMHLL